MFQTQLCPAVFCSNTVHACWTRCRQLRARCTHAAIWHVASQCFPKALRHVSIKLNSSCWRTYQVAFSKKTDQSTVLFQRTIGCFLQFLLRYYHCSLQQTSLNLFSRTLKRTDFLYNCPSSIRNVASSPTSAKENGPWLSLKRNCVKLFPFGEQNMNFLLHERHVSLWLGYARIKAFLFLAQIHFFFYILCNSKSCRQLPEPDFPINNSLVCLSQALA